MEVFRTFSFHCFSDGRRHTNPPSHTRFYFGTWLPSGKPDKLESVVSQSPSALEKRFHADFIHGTEERESVLTSTNRKALHHGVAWGGVCSSLARSLARSPRSLCGPSRAHRRRRGQRGACLCAAAARDPDPGEAPRAEPSRHCVGFRAGRIMQRSRTGEKTENEIALAS